MTGRFACVMALLLGVAAPAPARAQHEQHMPPPADAGWHWMLDAQAFVNFNIQERKFRDFHYLESQNWLMTAGARAVGRGRFGVHFMFTAEDYSMHRYGSPQVFQTGETYLGATLVDYQHPHDVVMAANARFEWPVNARWRLSIEGGPVGAPAIGPEVFMHRASAEGNPTAPLGHHFLDSTHVTHGVVTLGVTRGAFTAEGSAFHGREADEDRLRVEFGPIDSYAGRVSWRRGRWQAQVSGAHLKFPDPTEYTDHDMGTASVSYTGSWRERPLAVTLAAGVTRESAFKITSWTGLAEAAWHAAPRDLLYLRGELMKKDLLTAGGYHPPGFAHDHMLSRIGALTLGYEREIARTRAGRFGIGGDATTYYRDPNLDENYGYPFSAHIFLRYRFTRP